MPRRIRSVPDHECKYYRVERLTVERRDIGLDALGAARALESPWCAHPKHSPMTRDTALSLGHAALRCRGLLGECVLAPGSFADCNGD